MKRSLKLRPSPRTTPSLALRAVNTQRRRSLSLRRGSKVLDKSTAETPGQAVRVFDEEGNDVTPQPLYQVDPGSVPTKASRFFLDEICVDLTSDHTTTSGSRSVLGSSRFSSQSSIESISEEIEEAFYKRDIKLPDAQVKRVSVKEEVTENTSNEAIEVDLTETDTISLLDISSTVASVDDDDAEAIKERNKRYAEVCKNRVGNDAYLDRSVQTLNDALKHKEVQSDSIGTEDAGTFVSTWEMYDTVSGSELDESVHNSEPEAEPPEVVVLSIRSADTSVSVESINSIGSAVSSLKDVEVFGNSSNAEAELQSVMLSEKFQQILSVMERNVLRNIFQPKLSVYRDIPVFDDPDHPPDPEDVEPTDEDSGNSPALRHLWTFSCELTRDHSVTCMAWNKKNLDLVAVGYRESESDSDKPGLVCCWSLKNIKWPGRVIHSDSAVTCMDFSTKHPSHLAVGMHNGTVAIYNVSRNNQLRVISSSACPNKHLDPVWQLRWTLQELTVRGQDKTEALFSVAADGRVSKWFMSNTGLDCSDVMKLDNIKIKAAGNQTEKRTKTVLTPGLCVDFHPIDSGIYLVGTWDGLIHKCSCSNSEQFMETYKKHFCPVNCIAWSPLNPSLFLSCSSDWTIQLWRQNKSVPVLGFTSVQKAGYDIRWSPKWATVFGVVNEGQLEIWNLNSSIMDPVIVQPAAPSVTMKCLLFAKHTDCVLVGDSAGQVTVYQLKNMGIGEGNQVDVLESAIRSAASRF